jgi:hypothetical protein
VASEDEMQKPYTVSELDALRKVVENKWVWGSYRIDPRTRYSRSYKETEKVKAVEELVRTHMIAGHYADDLLASEPPIPPEAWLGTTEEDGL